MPWTCDDVLFCCWWKYFRRMLSISEHFDQACFLRINFWWHASTDFTYSATVHWLFCFFVGRINGVYGNLEVWWRGQTWQSCAPELEAYEVGNFDEDGQKKTKDASGKHNFYLLGMVKTWPFQRLLVASNQGIKRSRLNDLVYIIGACSIDSVQLLEDYMYCNYSLLPSVQDILSRSLRWDAIFSTEAWVLQEEVEGYTRSWNDDTLAIMIVIRHFSALFNHPIRLKSGWHKLILNGCRWKKWMDISSPCRGNQTIMGWLKLLKHDLASA